MQNVNRKSKSIYVSLLCLLVAGLTASVASADSQSIDVQKFDAQAEVNAEACVYARHVRNIEVVDEQMLVLRGTADRFWLSRLPNKCSGLDDRMYLAIDRYGSKICANDRFTASERSGFRMSCRFGKFEPVVEATVAAAKVAAAGQ